MKKLIALALALVMVLAFAACTKAPAEDSGKKQIVSTLIKEISKIVG